MNEIYDVILYIRIGRLTKKKRKNEIEGRIFFWVLFCWREAPGGPRTKKNQKNR